MIPLIGITGRVGAGKTTIAEYLKSNYGFKIYSFSTPLKEVVSNLFLMPLDDFYNPNKKMVTNPCWGKTPREILQVFGTECIRNHFGRDFWVKRMGQVLKWDSLIVHGRFTSPVVIDDIRFPEETNMVIEKGGLLIKVVRSNNPYEIDQNHESERMIGIKYDTQINNDSDVQNLCSKVDHAMFYFDSRM